VLDAGMPGLEQSKPLRKMGMHSSPTGELFLDDVRVGKDRLLGESEDPPRRRPRGRQGHLHAWSAPGVAAMALGLIEECLELSLAYANDRVQFGQPIGDFQLIQDKLARMEVARLNVENLVFRTIEMSAPAELDDPRRGLGHEALLGPRRHRGRPRSRADLGGNGYMSEFRVEQLARDAKVLQIYAGTDEIQITHIAKGPPPPFSAAIRRPPLSRSFALDVPSPRGPFASRLRHSRARAAPRDRAVLSILPAGVPPVDRD
jgi:alkylation response protein AidB-like acyl-CoA dehydrogenase